MLVCNYVFCIDGSALLSVSDTGKDNISVVAIGVLIDDWVSIERTCLIFVLLSGCRAAQSP